MPNRNEQSTPIGLPFAGIDATGDGAGSMAFALTPDAMNQNLIRQAFLGIVTDEGSLGEDDHEGAMYWVQELAEVTRPDVPASGTTVLRLRKDLQDELEVTEPTPLWITARNLAETDVEDPDAEAHGVAAGTIVHVFATRTSRATTPRWYFTHAGGGLVRAGVIRDIPDPDGTLLRVQAVTEDDKGVLQWQGDVVTLQTWHGLRGRHYTPFVWPIDIGQLRPTTMTHVLPVVLTEGGWRVLQYLRWSFPPAVQRPVTEWPITDCNVVRI